MSSKGNHQRKMKIWWIAAISVILVALMGYQLYSNRLRLEENKKMSLEGDMVIPVAVVKPAWKNLDGGFSLHGTFYANRDLVLMAEGQGRALEIMFDVGRNVSEGQVLAVLDDEVVKVQHELAKAAFEKAGDDLGKFESLLKGGGASRQQFEEIRLAYLNAKTNLAVLTKQLDNTRIKAPFGGFITKKYIEKGTLIMPGAPVADITDISRIKFTGTISEQDLSKVHAGQKLTLTPDNQKDLTLTGTVRSVSAKSDDTRRFPVEVDISSNPGNKIRSGMYGMAYVDFAGQHKVLVLPRQCLVGSVKNPEIYVVESDKAILRTIEVGEVTDREMVILGGVKETDQVVLSGQLNLENGKKVKIAK